MLAGKDDDDVDVVSSNGVSSVIGDGVLSSSVCEDTA